MIYWIQWYMCSELNPIRDHWVLQPSAQAGPRPLLGFDKIRTRRRRCIGGVFLAQRCKFLLLFGGKIRKHGPEIMFGPRGTVAREVTLLTAMEACARNLSVMLFLIVRLPGTCEGSGSCRLRGSRCHAMTWSDAQLSASAPILSYLGARLSYLIPSKRAPI